MKMKVRLIMFCAVTCGLGISTYFLKTREQVRFEGSTVQEQPVAAADVPAVSSRVLALPKAELEILQSSATAGDCAAALKVGRHYSIGVDELEEAAKWLRLAAKCDDIRVKTEFINFLIAIHGEKASAAEVSELRSQIRILEAKYKRSKG
ncbi:MAG: hypothetical protein ACJ8GW_10750 [Massilia sp.]